jgi:hypothetical protein
MLDYYREIETIRIETHPAPQCDWLFVQGSRARGARAPASDWVPVWEGSRTGDRSELYRLYRRGIRDHHSIVRFPDRTG